MICGWTRWHRYQGAAGQRINRMSQKKSPTLMVGLLLSGFVRFTLNSLGRATATSKCKTGKREQAKACGLRNRWRSRTKEFNFIECVE